MTTVVTLTGLRALLAKDLGKIVLGSSAYDGWFSTFSKIPDVGLGDLSLKDFASLSYANSGPFSNMINSTLQLAKSTAGMSVTTGVVSSNGERLLTSGNDFWRGTTGADLVDAGNGNDILSLGSGSDTVYGGGGNDLIFGERGRDSLIGGAGNDTIFGGEDRDIIHGWNGDDIIFGGSGHDGLYGNQGNDTIFGGDGNDYICGGSGRDVIFGGAGADTFAFRGQAANSSTIIKDFELGYDKQLIMSSVVNGPLTMSMIKPYADGLMIQFTDNRAIYYEDVTNAAALFASMSLFE
jgi:Ca2+-binding RTX toxin-like protein